MAVPQQGTRLISYLGTTWLYLGAASEPGLHEVRCVSPNPQGLSSYQTGSLMNVPELWFDRCSVVDPSQGNPANGNGNGNGRNP